MLLSRKTAQQVNEIGLEIEVEIERLHMMSQVEGATAPFASHLATYLLGGEGELDDPPFHQVVKFKPCI